jgi:hypothetical protein
VARAGRRSPAPRHLAQAIGLQGPMTFASTSQGQSHAE